MIRMGGVCRNSMPTLLPLAESYRGSNLTAIGLQILRL